MVHSNQMTEFWTDPNEKLFADKNLNMNQKLKSALGRLENIVGKGENAGYQHFLLFLHCFQKASCTRVLKFVIV